MNQQYAGPLDCSPAQRLQRLVSLFQGKNLHMGQHRNLRRQGQELRPVLPGEVGHGAQNPLPKAAQAFFIFKKIFLCLVPRNTR